MTQERLTNPVLVRSSAITHAANGTTVLAVEVPAGHWVPPYGVSVYVAEVFAGGTPSMTVGDGDDVDGWLTSANITEATVGTYSSVAAAYAITGKFYSTADTIDVVVDDTTLTAGTCYVLVVMFDLSDPGMPAA